MTTSSSIQPLDSTQQQLVVDKTLSYIKKASNLFDIKETSIDISFDLKGHAAGMYRVRRKILKTQREIRYNAFIFSKYFDDNLKTTVPHEVAHYISDLAYGLKNIRPHGKEWKTIMQAFNADDSVTANYDLTGTPQRIKTLYTYQCNCTTHELSAIRHNRINRNQRRYVCKNCNQTLSFTPESLNNQK